MEQKTMSDHIRLLRRDQLQRLLDALGSRGFQIMGPVERSETVVYRRINKIEELPVGRVDEQTAGQYRLKDGDGRSLFSYTVGPDSWKKFLHRPAVKLFSVERQDGDFQVVQADEPSEKMAFFGVRACELNAIAIQDRVFLEGAYVDPHYQRMREGVFIVAVNCARAGGSCFCVSMDAGPKARSGFDLSLTEILDEDEHVFVVEIGTERGAEILSDLDCPHADQSRIQAVDRIIEHTEQQMGRSIETQGLQALLSDNPEHPRWDEVAERCLSCGNCTMVCPTCFCTTVEDVTDLAGDTAERWRKWDSCFTGDFSYIHGGQVRASVKSRYRQWMTHKLSTWIDQFDTSGCVGCGRCITWCPVGIDITEEAAAIRGNEEQPDKEEQHGNPDA